MNKLYLYDEWLEIGNALYGSDTNEWKFKCPRCGHIQTGKELKDRGDKELYRTCIDCTKCNYSTDLNPEYAEMAIVSEEDGTLYVFDFADEPQLPKRRWNDEVPEPVLEKVG
jgi:transcription elongation factor Elf1